MGHLQSQEPLELVCIDFLCLEPDIGGKSNILVVTDHFTRYAQAYPTKGQKASTVAKVLVEKFFIHYGLPVRIHSDQGRDFESRLICQLCAFLGIKKTRTTPYHPQGDPQPELFNRTLLNMLGTLPSDKKQHWGNHIAALVHAYSCMESDVTGYSPYRLMFGREARLPADLALDTSLDDVPLTSHRGYVDRLRKNLRQAYEQAAEHATVRESWNKQNFDAGVKIHDLQPGDRVLLKNLGIPGKHKLADRWKSQLFIVCKRVPGLPVYQIQPEGESGPRKMWHRNHLLPLSDAVRVPEASQTSPGRLKLAGTRSKGNKARETDGSDESGDDYEYSENLSSRSLPGNGDSGSIDDVVSLPAEFWTEEKWRK